MAAARRVERTSKLVPATKMKTAAESATPVATRQSPIPEQASNRNWLADLDSHALSLQARQWISYSFFMLARYPQLRPHQGQEVFEVIRADATAIVDRCDDSIIRGLSEDRRLQLGALILDLDAASGDAARDRPRRKDMKRARRHSTGWVNRLAGKLETASKALDHLAEYLDEIRNRGTLSASLTIPSELTSTTVRVQADAYRLARSALNAERISESADAMLGAGYLPEGRAPRDLKAVTTECLTSYFVHGCNLSKTEADIRTAGIGNTLWKWDDPILDKYDGTSVRSRGAETTRSRRRRRAERRP